MKREFCFEDDRPFAECHASSVARVGDEYLVVYFAGTGEKFDDVGIWGSRREATGRWRPPQLLAKVCNQAHWNPVVFAAPDGALHLWFKVGRSVPAWSTWTTVSRDGGAVWETPRELVPGDTRNGRGPVKNKPILLSDGAWLAGASREVDDNPEDRWDAFVDRSEDDGRTWVASDYLPIDRDAVPGAGVIQPTLWESAPGRVHMLLRSTCQRVCRSDSTDGGRTWSTIRPTDLPHNNSGIDIARLPGGTLALALNPVEGSWPDRSPLSLLVSEDNGVTWSRRLDLVHEPGCEFSYPAVIPEGDAVTVTYTWKRERIAFHRVPLEAIVEAPNL